MNIKPPYYRVYLLTVWQEQKLDPPKAIIWRYRLEEPHSGRQQLFTDARSLLAALKAFAAEPLEPPDDTSVEIDIEPPDELAEKGGDNDT